SFMTVVVRTKSDPAALTRPVASAIREIEKGQPVSRIAPMTKTIAASVARRTFAALLLGLFGALSLLLAIVGVAGIMAYTVAQRTPEFGVRMAVGAQPAQVWRHVLQHGLRLTA